MGDLPDSQPRRREKHAQWRAALLGLAIGLILASAFSVVQARDYAKPAITLLGSGDGLSLLVTTADARVLIAGGSNPAAFANAFADARPRTIPRIDLLIELPDSRLVASRAWALARPSAMLTLSTARRFEDEPPATPISAPMAIDLPGGVTVLADPGGGGDWSISIAFGGSTALVVPAWSAAAGRADVALVVVAAGDGPTTAPRASAVAAPAPAAAEDVVTHARGDALLGHIAPGDAVRLAVGKDGGLRAPAAWRAPVGP